jgi:SNF2 family DNA or RNA helicase
MDWLKDPKFQAMYDQLKKVRESKTVELRPTPMMKNEIIGFDGNPQPFNLRYYQVQGIFHLLSVNRMVLGDGTGLGKTIQAIGAMCYLWERDPNMKVMVVCPKSAIRQWYSEVERFAIGVKVFMAIGTPTAREKAYRDWAEYQGPSILALNYHAMVRDWDHGIKKEAPEPGAKKGTQPKLGQGLLDGLTSKASNLVVIFDEASAFKNPSTKTHQTAKFLSEKAKRVWGLTATLLKNRLEEGFGVYKVIRPNTFTSKTRFLDDYCQVEMQRARGGIRVPVIIGYKNLAQFRAVIDPFFYGRPKHAVSNELPALTTREVLCELSPVEDRKYAEALQGVMLMGDGNLKDYQETKDLTALIYCQQVCNSLALLKFEDGAEVDTDLTFEGKSAKEAALLDLLSEEYDDEKVIVYTRFESLVGRLQTLLAKEGIKSVRITGKEGDKARKKAQDTFQDMSNPIKVVIITDAASEAINLQAAQATIFFDTPWSWGTYVQLLGRMIRIGSPHPNVNAIHLMAERPGQAGKRRETIDHKVIAKLRSKKGVIDQIIGEAAQGALRFERSGGDIGELLKSIKETV